MRDSVFDAMMDDRIVESIAGVPPKHEWRGDFNPKPWLPEANFYIAKGIDIRDVIEAFDLNFNRGAVLKYLARAGRKPGNDPLMDMRKARVHLDREIARLESSTLGV